MKNRLLAAILSMSLVFGGMTVPALAEEITSADVINAENEFVDENVLATADSTVDSIEGYPTTVNPSFDKVVKALSTNKKTQNMSDDKNKPYYSYSDGKNDNSGGESVGYDYHLQGEMVTFTIGSDKRVYHPEDNYRQDEEMLSIDYRISSYDGNISVSVYGTVFANKDNCYEEYKLYKTAVSAEEMTDLTKAIAVGPSYRGNELETYWTLENSRYAEGYTAEPGVLMNKYYGACYDRISKSLGKLTGDTTLTCAKLVNNENVAEDRQATNEPISYNPMKKNAYNAVVRAIKSKGSAWGDGHLYTLNRSITGTDGKKYFVEMSYTDNSPSYAGGPVYRHIEVSVKEIESSSEKKPRFRYAFDFNPDEDASPFLRVVGGIDCTDKDANGGSNEHSATIGGEYSLTENNLKLIYDNIISGPTDKNSQPAGSDWWINSMKANPFASIEEERAELSEPYLRYLKELNAFLVSITGDSDVALEKIVNDTKDFDASKKPTVEVVTYKIAYAGVEGVANVDTFVAEGTSNKAVNLPKAKEVVKEGYTFAGWYLNDKKVTKIAKKNTSDVTVTAKWKENQYKISYKVVFPKEMKGYKASDKVSDKTKYGYESTIKILGSGITAASKKSPDVYKLAGWSRTKNPTEVEYKVDQELTHFGGRTAKEKTVTLYPVWEKVEQGPVTPVGELVWIPINGGTKYHKNSSCSSMVNPEEVDLAVAKSKGYEPCGKCYK